MLTNVDNYLKIIYNIFRYVNTYAYTCGVESNVALDIKTTTNEKFKRVHRTRD